MFGQQCGQRANWLINMSKLLIIVMTTAVLVLSLPSRAEPPKGYPFVSFDQGMQQAQQQHKRAFIYFGRFGCGFCNKVNQESFSDNNLRQLYTKNYALIYVDAESGNRITLPDGERITEMELGARLNAVGTPLFLYMEPGGDIILRAPGYKTVQEFVLMDEFIQGNHFREQSINDYFKQKGKLP